MILNVGANQPEYEFSYCNSQYNCPTDYECYQPPMPLCPEGMGCPQVMPQKYCRPIDCSSTIRTLWLQHDQPLTFEDHTIEIIGSNPDETQCGVIVDGVAKWVNVDEKKEFSDLSIRILDTISVHTDQDVVNDPGYWMCIINIANQINFTFEKTDNEAKFHFGGHDISAVDVGNDYTKCGIEVDGVVQWIDQGDNEYFGDLKIEIMHIEGYPADITPSYDADVCEIEIIPCRCDKENDCSFSCSDSDGGKDYNEKGTTTGWNSYGGNINQIATHVDRCDGSNRVLEFYCNYINDPRGGEGYISMHNSPCSNGCQDGKCVDSINTCSDTDGGINYYVKGHAQSSNSNVEGRIDCCKNEFSTNMGSTVDHIGPGGGPCVTSGKYLHEGYCGSDNNPTSKMYECPDGCTNGACVSEGYTCEQIQDSSLDYFETCKKSGYQGVCFDKLTKEYQGCTNDNGKGCTSSNSNAQRNIFCEVPSSMCTETDGGINLNVRGVNRKGSEIKEDHCTYCTGACVPGEICDSTCGAVVEYYCNSAGNIIEKSPQTCKYGCEYGECRHSSDYRWKLVPDVYYDKSTYVETDSGRIQATYLGTCDKFCGSLGLDANPKCIGWHDKATYCRKTVSSDGQLASAGSSCTESGLTSQIGGDYCCCGESQNIRDPYIADISGEKSKYYAKEPISLIIKAVEGDGTPAEYSEGFHIQYYSYSTLKKEDYLQEYVPTGNYNARYSNGYWYIDFWAPSIPGKYYTDIVLYCSRDNTKCSREYPNLQVEEKLYYEVNEKTNECSVSGECEAVFSHCSCSYSCMPKTDEPRVDCARACPEIYVKPPTCECKNGECVEKYEILPEKCSFGPQISCVDKAKLCSGNDLSLIALRNNVGFPIQIKNIEITNYNQEAVIFPDKVQPNEIFKVKFQDLNLASGQYAHFEVKMDYVNLETGLQHSLNGEIQGKAVNCGEDLCEIGTRCDSNYIQKCYPEEGWRNVEYCSYGCDDGKCKGDCGDDKCYAEEIYSCAEDCNIYENLLILKDIWPYQFKYASHQIEDNNDYGKLLLYEATYMQGSHDLEVAVVQLENEEIANDAFKKELLREGKYTIQKINGYLVYLVEDRYVWVNDNYIIMVEKDVRNAYPVIVDEKIEVEVSKPSMITGNVVKGAVLTKEAIGTAVQRLESLKNKLVEQSTEKMRNIKAVSKPMPGRPTSVVEAYLIKYPSTYAHSSVCGDGICDYSEFQTCIKDCVTHTCPNYMPVSPEIKNRCIELGGTWVTGETVNDCPVPPYCVNEERDDELTEVDKLTIIMKLESLNIRILELKNKALGLANYYNDLGETKRAEVWVQAASDFEELANKITAVQKEIQNSNLDNTKKLMKEFVKDVKESLKEIIGTIMIGLTEEVGK